VDSLLAIRELHERHGHVQEVIVQNFRAKPRIPMARQPEPSLDDLRRTLAVARLLLGPDMNVQAPPNLSPGTYPALIASGLNDWGGVSPLTIDHINPEAPWPHLAALEAATAAAGARLRERLALYPEFIRRPGFVPEPLRHRVLALVDASGLVPERAVPVGI
jgi:FO synthase